MRLLEFTLLFDQDWRGGTWPRAVEWIGPNTGPALASVKCGAYELNQTSMVDIAGCRDNQIVVRKLARVKCERQLVMKGWHRRSCAFHRASPGLGREKGVV